MKRRDLIKQLESLGCVFKRDGAEHDIYLKGSLRIAVPRHNEINEITAKKILKKAGLK